MRVFSSLHDPGLIPLLRVGAVGVIPTDTIYGLAASALDEVAVARMYQLKHREHKPGTTIAASTDQLRQLGVPMELLIRAARWWPNSVSILLPVAAEYSYLHQGLGDCAFRVPAVPAELLKLLGSVGPLCTTSANQPGEPPATNLAEAQKYFGDQVDFYVDGGQAEPRPPSTIIRVKTDGSVELLRAGAVIIDEKR